MLKYQNISKSRDQVEEMKYTLLQLTIAKV